MKRFLVAASLAVLASAAFALPTIEAVQAEIAQGHYAQGEEMMREVVVAKPGSAKARYVYAEILAHDKRFDLAAEEVAQARKIDPGLHFTQPEKFEAFARLLEREQGAAGRVPMVTRIEAPVLPQARSVQPAGRVPTWLWGVGAAALALIAWRSLATRRPSALPNAAGAVAWPGAAGVAGAQGSGAAGAAPPVGYGFGYPPAAPAAAASGLLGTGMAAAGGMAAGMLAERLFEGHLEQGPGTFAAPGMRAAEPGLFDDASAGERAARELEQRPIDIGTGEGWGGDDAVLGTDDSLTSGDGDGW